MAVTTHEPTLSLPDDELAWVSLAPSMCTDASSPLMVLSRMGTQTEELERTCLKWSHDEEAVYCLQGLELVRGGVEAATQLVNANAFDCGIAAHLRGDLQMRDDDCSEMMEALRMMEGMKAVTRSPSGTGWSNWRLAESGIRALKPLQLLQNPTRVFKRAEDTKALKDRTAYELVLTMDDDLWERKDYPSKRPLAYSAGEPKVWYTKRRTQIMKPYMLALLDAEKVAKPIEHGRRPKYSTA